MDPITLALGIVLMIPVAFLSWSTIRDARRLTRLRAALDEIVAGGSSSMNGTAKRLARIADNALLADDGVHP